MSINAQLSTRATLLFVNTPKYGIVCRLSLNAKQELANSLRHSLAKITKAFIQPLSKYDIYNGYPLNISNNKIIKEVMASQKRESRKTVSEDFIIGFFGKL